MFCYQCGTKLEDEAAFCHICGASQAEGNSREKDHVTDEVLLDRMLKGEKHAEHNMHFDDKNHDSVQSRVTPPPLYSTNWSNSYFDGGLMGLIGINLVVALFSLITLGLAWPMLCCFRLKWVYRHTVIGGYRLKFNGSGLQLFGKFILWVFLTIVTATIYVWWLPIKYKKWEISHVEIDSMILDNMRSR